MPDGSGVFRIVPAPDHRRAGRVQLAPTARRSPSNGPLAGLVQIFDTSFTFNTLSGNQLTIPLQPKQIQDEMGEAFDPDYGRMSGFLGVEAPNANALACRT